MVVLGGWVILVSEVHLYYEVGAYSKPTPMRLGPLAVVDLMFESPLYRGTSLIRNHRPG